MSQSIQGFAMPAHGRPTTIRRVLTAVAAAVAVLALGFTAAPDAEAAPSVPNAAKAHPTLKYGDRGTAVKYIQQRLKVSPKTGYFGPKTRAAVKKYEKKIGVKVDGVVDPKVWKALGVKKAKSTSKVSSTSKGKKILAEAKKHKGKPYKYGGSGPKSFDCSGFVGYVLKKSIGKKVPRTSAAIRKAVPRISKSSLRPGDLVFVHNGGGGRVSHVAIYAGNNKWWEATRPGRPLGLNKAWSKNVSYGRVT